MTGDRDTSSWPSLSQQCSLQHEHQGWQVRHSDIAVLSLNCRPNHNVNVHISMNHKSDQQFVDGELKVARKPLSALQMSTDSEFSTDSKWQELGGSEQAAWYLMKLDHPLPCSNRTAAEMLKELGPQRLAPSTWERHTQRRRIFSKIACINDLCHDAGETLALNLQHSFWQWPEPIMNSWRRKHPPVEKKTNDRLSSCLGVTVFRQCI